MIQVMNGRAFAGQQVEAWVTDGSQKFKKSQSKSGDDADEAERLEKFANWLESESKSEESKGGIESASTE